MLSFLTLATRLLILYFTTARCCYSHYVPSYAVPGTYFQRFSRRTNSLSYIYFRDAYFKLLCGNSIGQLNRRFLKFSLKLGASPPHPLYYGGIRPPNPPTVDKNTLVVHGRPQKKVKKGT